MKKLSIFFPHKMKKFTSEEEKNLINKDFKIIDFYSSDNSITNDLDSILTFNSNGDIVSNNKKIGKWNTDRNIFLSNFEKKIYIYISYTRIKSKFTVDI